MKAHEGIIAGVSTLITYLACPDILNKWETTLFLIVVFGCSVAAIWSLEEFQKRLRMARRIRNRKRRVYNINLRYTGLVEESGKEVQLNG